MRLDASVKNLKGIGPKAAELLEQKEIRTVGDLLRFYPSGYTFFEDVIPVEEAEAGCLCTLRLVITGAGGTVRAGKRVITHFEAADPTGKVRLTFFNMPYVRQTLRPGAAFVFRGTMRVNRAGNRFLEQPWFREERAYEQLRGTLQPRYVLPKGIGEERMRAFLRAALEAAYPGMNSFPETGSISKADSIAKADNISKTDSIAKEDNTSKTDSIAKTDAQSIPSESREKAAEPDAGSLWDPALDSLPPEYRKRYDLLPLPQAVREIHFPSSREYLLQARRRLIFDEFFTFIIGIRRRKEAEGVRANPRPLQEGGRSADTLSSGAFPCGSAEDRQSQEPAEKADGMRDGATMREGGWCARFLDSLPFSLTDEQARAWAEIRADLTGPVLMNRLLQGDVGSGKTVLAFLALILCAENGRQGALMAPTEVLAQQHMQGFSEIMEKSGLPVRPVLLTGSVKGQPRKEALRAIADGSASVVIGTHALFQEKVQFHDLGLVVTDEQHRFGVRQRTGLVGKGEDVPVLVMSATPIPRTLAIILYGELQVSSLKKLPPGRQPVKSLAMQESQRGRAYRFILSQIEKGRQCYVICPAVEEGEMQELQNVADYTEKLRRALPAQLRIDSMNGRMRAGEKNRVMDDFSHGKTDILVSTTVIEVGINVPNATVILIENAERFGLSQLHQLRGRVGRGKEQSYCIFLYSGKEKPDRLAILEKNTNGFSIADEDLKARGPGDLFGIRQSGLPRFALADLYEDADILRDACACADEILRQDPDFHPADERTVDFSTI